jgi:hypothetical protein
MELSLFQKYQELKPNTKKVNKRGLIIQEFTDEINKERPYTYIDKNGKKKKVGLITPRAVAIKLGHIKNEFDLVYFLSECRDYKNRSGSFARKFFGAIKDCGKLA